VSGGCVIFQNLTNLDRSRETRSIQSHEKERTDLSGRSWYGHFVLVCAKSVQSAAEHALFYK